jgi:hypothetical protein
MRILEPEDGGESRVTKMDFTAAALLRKAVKVQQQNEYNRLFLWRRIK